MSKQDESSSQISTKKKSDTREIQGNIPYTASPNSIGKVLTAIISAERPDKFSNNFLETVLNQTGGGARAVPPFLKKMGFLAGDGTPTDLYSKFKTDSGRADAAFNGLKNAFQDIFRKNEHAHQATDEKLLDLIVEVTGLTKTDAVARHMLNSFKNVREFLPKNYNASGHTSEESEVPDEKVGGEVQSDVGAITPNLGLSYQINIVLPESENPMIYDSIFKSLRKNLLRE